MSEHRWSGWPGAWCLDCGAEDPREMLLAGIGVKPCQRPEQCTEPMGVAEACALCNPVDLECPKS